MRVRMVPVSCMAVVCLLGLARPSAAACDPEGDVKFVCGMVSPEDLAAIPQSPWVIVSSMEHEGHLGHLYVADARDHSTTVLFPTATARPRHDTATYGSCPGPATRNQFEPHGISLRPGSNGNHTLYVVRHGSRESIEVFQVETDGASPTLTWVGCAVAPETLGLNAVVALPDGGFAATNPRTGDVWEWHSGTGWNVVPGSEGTGPNGLARRSVVLYRRMGQPVGDSLVAWADTGLERRRGGRVSYRQRPLGPRWVAACCRSQRERDGGDS